MFDDREIDLGPLIDHALLVPTATPEQVEQWCEAVDRFQFASVCLHPCYVRQAAELLHGRRARVCTVIGFPYGATTTETKLYEAAEAVEQGATELDVVINLGWLKTGKTEAVHREIAEICAETGQTVKAILEMGLLSEGEKKLAAELCMDAGARFLKTSTGLYGGATVADVRLLKELGGDRVEIKAAGGIRTVAEALEWVAAGAAGWGAAGGVELMRQREAQGREGV